jgi:2'-5' RNA ligase
VRLFVALAVPPAVRDNLAAAATDLSGLASKSSTNKVRWTHPENLHVTLKFIGNVAAEKLDEIRDRLARIHSEQPVELRFRGLGCFPGAKRPKVIWAGIAGSQNLAGLADDIDRSLAQVGVPTEQRTFTPHLTLARCERSAISPELRAAIEKDMARDFGGLRTKEFHLIESKLKPSGAEYTTLQTFAFTTEA